MSSAWPHYAILRVASLLAPRDRRAEWVKEWRSELWYVPRCQATPFCMGAFRDALWLRRNNPGPVTRTGIGLESPLSCLAFLATLAALSVFIAVHLPALPHETVAPLKARDLPGVCIGMLSFTDLLLLGTLALWWAPANRHPMPWPGRLRWGIFLALKIALVQPMMLSGFRPVIPESRSGSDWTIPGAVSFRKPRARRQERGGNHDA